MFLFPFAFRHTSGSPIENGCMQSIADARQPFGSARIAGAYNPTLSDLLLLLHLLHLLLLLFHLLLHHLLFHLILLLFHLLLLFIPVGAYNLTLSDLLLLLLRLSSYQSIDTQPCSNSTHNSSPTFSNPLPHLFHSPFLVNYTFAQMPHWHCPNRCFQSSKKPPSVCSDSQR